MKKLYKILSKIKEKIYYSQFGEDITICTILAFLFDVPKTNITYIDVGSNEPVAENNTYYFYVNHGHGVCIEPNPFFVKKYKKYRPKDIFINAGIGFDKSITHAKYYDFGKHAHALNTFSTERRDMVVQTYPLIATHDIPLVTLNDVCAKLNEKIDIISIDVEGLELQILSSFDFDNIKFRPKLFCIEANKTDVVCGYKSELVKFMESKDYVVVADNFINMIFADIHQMKSNKQLFCNEKLLKGK